MKSNLTKGKQFSQKLELNSQFPKAAHIFAEPVVAEEIARLRFKRASFESELKHATHLYDERKKLITR